MVSNIDTSDECCNESGRGVTSESSTTTEPVSTNGSAITTTKSAVAWQLNSAGLTESNVGKRVMTDGGKGAVDTPKDGERGYETDVRGSAEDAEHQDVAVGEIIDTAAVGVVATEENTDRVVRTVLRAIDRTTTAAHEGDAWVGMCGEMAGDPALTELLVGLGLDELSMSAVTVPAVKQAVRGIDGDAAATLARDALACETRDEVAALLP